MKQTRYGIGKRLPTYAPLVVRDHLMSMSKADLAEIVADYLIRSVGEAEAADQPTLLVRELLETANAIRMSQGRTPVKADALY